MTLKESYAKGFCKVAEAYGVDPAQLYKYAGGVSPKIEKLLFGTKKLNKAEAKIVRGVLGSARKSSNSQRKVITELLTRDVKAHYPTLGRNPSRKQLLEAINTASGLNIMNTPEFARFAKTQQMEDLAIRALTRSQKAARRAPSMVTDIWAKGLEPREIPFGYRIKVRPGFIQKLRQDAIDSVKAKRGGGRAGLPRNAEEYIADMKHDMAVVPKKAPPKKSR